MTSRGCLCLRFGESWMLSELKELFCVEEGTCADGATWWCCWGRIGSARPAIIRFVPRRCTGSKRAVLTRRQFFARKVKNAWRWPCTYTLASIGKNNAEVNFCCCLCLQGISLSCQNSGNAQFMNQGRLMRRTHL